MFALTPDNQSKTYRLTGSLTLNEVKEAQRAFRDAVNKGGIDKFDASALEKLDTAGGLLLRRVMENAKINLTGLSAGHQSVMNIVSHAELGAPTPKPPRISVTWCVERVGMAAVNFSRQFLNTLIFLGHSMVALGAAIKNPVRFRLSALSRHVQETGINAIPIVGLVAFLISIVLAYQGRFQLRPFGAERFTINLVGISVLREMGVLLTAIMVAGRSGSAFTAELGMMKVNEEIDALEVMGIDPFESLVLPRLMALFIALPLLTFIADMLGLMGGAVISIAQLGIPWDQYFDQIRRAVHDHDFFVGMIKAPVFALIIALIGCQYGMEVSGSAESVGRQTTKSVVHATFIILMADAVFSIVFAQMGI